MSTIESIAKQQEVPVLSARITNFVYQLLASIKAHSVLFVITAIYITATQSLISTVPGLQPYQPSLSFFTILLEMLWLSMVILITLRFIRICVHVKPQSPSQALYHDLKNYLFVPQRLLLGIPVIIVLFFFSENFSYAKVTIPRIVPFQWDLYFMEMDRWLHFGYHPWELLQPVLGYAPVTFLININYNLWFAIVWTAIICMAFAPRLSILRLQFFIALMLVWSVGGSIFAVIYSSAGPAFYENLNLSPNPYKDLMAYLYQVNQTLPIWALDTQELLWSAHESPKGVVGGISAMPSIHNATAVILALLGWRINRTLGISLTIFTVFIFLGSIHLGWHYAIDGYLGAAIAIAAWWCAGKIATWAHNRPATRIFQA